MDKKYGKLEFRTAIIIGQTSYGKLKENLDMIKRELAIIGFDIKEVINIMDKDKINKWVTLPVALRPLIIAAGGDGIVGSVANYVAKTGCIVGIIPLGTSNDTARSLAIPLNIEQSIKLFKVGKITNVDLGELVQSNRESTYFIHAAAIGLSVKFAELATKANVRKKFKKFTYLISTINVLQKLTPFKCTIRFEGKTYLYNLLHLSLTNSQVFGGAMNLKIPGGSINDKKLDLLFIESAPLYKIILAVISLLLPRKRYHDIIHLYHINEVDVMTNIAHRVTIDGEILGKIPGIFKISDDAFQVITPIRFSSI